ncbi:MAG TPA: hypothetical protein VJS39_03455 [Gemmatimonadaceae bacterium]|nr:hypothetical protein [Gemmatimonadaceae bacterium]
MTTATQRRPQSAPGWDPLPPSVPPEEFEILRAWHPNLLIGGSREATTAALDALCDVLRPTIVSWAGGGALPMPSLSNARTLILRDADLLSPEDQQRLLAWLKQDSRSVQVVATATRPLVELVESANFDASLYYALNVICINLRS